MIIRILVVVSSALILIGCSSQKEDSSVHEPQPASVEVQTTPEVERNDRYDSFSEGKITIEYGRDIVDVARFNDHDVIAKHKVEYFPETDRIKNLDQLDVTSAVKGLFGKPFLNLNFGIPDPTKSESLEPDINSALRAFGIQLSVDSLERLQRAPDYRPIKVATPEIAVYLMRYSDSAYSRWIVELERPSREFESALPFDLSPRELEDRLGEPNFRKEDGSVFIYCSLISMQQLNVTWTEGRVAKLQYIAWSDW